MSQRKVDRGKPNKPSLSQRRETLPRKYAAVRGRGGARSGGRGDNTSMKKKINSVPGGRNPLELPDSEWPTAMESAQISKMRKQANSP